MIDLLIDEVEQYIAEHQPVDPDEIEREFGYQGLKCVRVLRSQNRVGRNIDFDLVTYD